MSMIRRLAPSEIRNAVVVRDDVRRKRYIQRILADLVEL